MLGCPNARHRSLLVLSLAALTIVACGGDDGVRRRGWRRAARSEPSAFPATIAHKYGSTTSSGPPERVVVVGLREQDALLALGVVPVATTEWYGKKPGAIFEWARDELGGAHADRAAATPTACSSRRSRPSGRT